MKKNIKLASALLLLNATLFTPITTVVNAQSATPKTGVTTDPGTTDPGTTDPDTTDEEALTQAKQQLQDLINEAKTYLDYSKYSNDFLFYLENYIINAEAALADPNSTIDDIQAHIDVLTTSISYAKDPTNIREENTNISINATDKVMYVGDVLTPEMVLEWATVDNADGLYLEAEVVGNPIMINPLDNTLVQAGTYTIRYTVKSTDPEGNPLSSKVSPKMSVISKDITLTVLDNEAEPVPSEPVVPVVPINPATPKDTNNTLIQPTVTNVSKYTQRKVNKGTSKLPETGETESSNLVLLGAMLVLSGTYIFNKKRYSNDLNL